MTSRLIRIACVVVALLTGCVVGNVLADSIQCGSERSAVKHLTDDSAVSAVNLTPRPATIAELAAMELEHPVGLKTRRGEPAPAEFETFTVEATVFYASLEDDQDVHLGLSDGSGHTMIAEAVDPRCASGSKVLHQIITTRVAIRRLIGGPLTTARLQKLIGKRLRLMGVGFFDIRHARKQGAAPNNVELHPVLKLEVLR